MHAQARHKMAQAVICVCLISLVKAENRTWKVNFGPNQFKLEGYENMGNNGFQSTGTAGVQTKQFADGPVLKMGWTGSRKYPDIVSGPLKPLNFVLSTFLFAEGDLPKNATVSNLEVGRPYVLTIIMHDTSTNNVHPHHIGRGSTFIVAGATSITKFMRRSDNGNNPRADEARWKIQMLPNDQGIIVITYISIFNALFITETPFLSTAQPTISTTAIPQTTAPPTLAPTPWYAHTNFTDLQDRVKAIDMLLTRVDALETTNIAYKTDLATLQSANTHLANTVTTLVATVDDLTTKLATQTETLGTVESALLDVVDLLPSEDSFNTDPGMSTPPSPSTTPSPCVGTECLPSVRADGQSLKLSARASTVQVHTAKCGTYDICDEKIASNQKLAAILTALRELDQI